MFRPNTTCLLYRSSGGTTVHGQPIIGAAKSEPCSIIHVSPKGVKTPISTHVSASRASADEMTADAVILLTPVTQARRGDVVGLDGGRYKIIGMYPQHDVRGRLDHFETHAMIYTQAE